MPLVPTPDMPIEPLGQVQPSGTFVVAPSIKAYVHVPEKTTPGLPPIPTMPSLVMSDEGIGPTSNFQPPASLPPGGGRSNTVISSSLISD